MSMTTMPDLLHAYLSELPLHRAIIRAIEARLYRMYVGYLQEPILDVGSGDGSFAEVILPHAEVYGIDPLPKDTREAAGRGCYRGLTVANGSSIPHPDKAFASVFCNCVLEHVIPLRETLAEIARVTAPGGLFIATVVTDRHSNSLLGYAILEKLAGQGKRYSDFLNNMAHHHNLLSREGWVAEMERVGFDVIERIPYMGLRTMKFFDFAHYYAIPSLVSYKLTGRWHLSEKFNINRVWETFLRESYDNPVAEDGTCLFMICRRR
jgi:ubiquinone/menaquinone biosynthesis C-methylase UbiE